MQRLLQLSGPGEAMNAKVTVTVNGKPATLFLGLCIRHAIGARAARAVAAGRATVTDADGNQVGLDGALYDGEALIVHKLGDAQPSPPAKKGQSAGQIKRVSPTARASAEQMRRRHQAALETLANDERLRSALADDEAQALLDWGRGQMSGWVNASAAIADDAQAAAFLRLPVQRVIAVMRGVNGFIAGKDSNATGAALDTLTGVFAGAGQAAADPAIVAACRTLLAERGRLSDKAIVQRLTALGDEALPHPAKPA